VIFLGQWDKLIDRVLEADRAFRFDELAKVLNKIGYTQHQPRGGSSHYVFRAPGLPPISIPKNNPINKVYVNLVREAVIVYLNEVNSNE
jgi:hypothetical protein